MFGEPPVDYLHAFLDKDFFARYWTHSNVYCIVGV